MPIHFLRFRNMAPLRQFSHTPNRGEIPSHHGLTPSGLERHLEARVRTGGPRVSVFATSDTLKSGQAWSSDCMRTSGRGTRELRKHASHSLTSQLSPYTTNSSVQCCMVAGRAVKRPFRVIQQCEARDATSAPRYRDRDTFVC